LVFLSYTQSHRLIYMSSHTRQRYPPKPRIRALPSFNCFPPTLPSQSRLSYAVAKSCRQSLVHNHLSTNQCKTGKGLHILRGICTSIFSHLSFFILTTLSSTYIPPQYTHLGSVY